MISQVKTHKSYIKQQTYDQHICRVAFPKRNKLNEFVLFYEKQIERFCGYY